MLIIKKKFKNCYKYYGLVYYNKKIILLFKLKLLVSKNLNTQ